MSAYVRQFLLLCGLTVFGFLVFVLFFSVGAAASITILFYRGVILAAVAAMITALAAFWVGRRFDDTTLPVAAAALSLSFNVCFLVLLPVTVDRSVSVYLLSTIERDEDHGIDASALQRAFIDGYVLNMGAIDRRIDEQQRSGNITVGPAGQVHLTQQGRWFMAVSRLIARLFGTDPRFVNANPKTLSEKNSSVDKHPQKYG